MCVLVLNSGPAHTTAHLTLPCEHLTKKLKLNASCRCLPHRLPHLSKQLYPFGCSDFSANELGILHSSLSSSLFPLNPSRPIGSALQIDLKSVHVTPSPLPTPCPSCHRLFLGPLQWPAYLVSLLSFQPHHHP